MAGVDRRQGDGVGAAARGRNGDKLLWVWQTLGGDPGEVWPHRWNSGDIAEAVAAVRTERDRLYANMRQIIQDGGAKVE